MKILVSILLNEIQKRRLESIAPHAEFIYIEAEEVNEKDLENVEVIFGNVNPSLLKYAENLKWIQLKNAGTEGFCEGVLKPDTILTNVTGAFGMSISEHMIAMLFSLRKKLQVYCRNQEKHQWKKEGNVGIIEGSCILVIGLGDIGSTFAKKMKGLGCTVLGVKRRESKKPDWVDELYLTEQIDELLSRADVVALSVPGNEDTYHILNKERIAKLRENAVVLNVGRGSAIDTEALTEALKMGKIQGAGLDVTDPEPLPEEHPLWELENVIITPHVSGESEQPENLEKIIDIWEENLRHYVNGEELKNVIDRKTGYVAN